jgi:hypothetical protein
VIAACSGGHSSTPVLVRAAVGTWTCRTASVSTPVALSIHNGTFSWGRGGQGTWSLDANGVQIVVSGVQLQIVNPQLDTSRALAATTATLRGSLTPGTPNISQTVRFTGLGTNTVTFRADPSAPGLASDTWTCTR